MIFILTISLTISLAINWCQYMTTEDLEDEVDYLKYKINDNDLDKIVSNIARDLLDLKENECCEPQVSLNKVKKQNKVTFKGFAPLEFTGKEIKVKSKSKTNKITIK